MSGLWSRPVFQRYYQLFRVPGVVDFLESGDRQVMVGGPFLSVVDRFERELVALVRMDYQL